MTKLTRYSNIEQEFLDEVADSRSFTNKWVNWICEICATKLGMSRTEFKDRIEDIPVYRFWPIVAALMSNSTERIEKAKRVCDLIKWNQIIYKQNKSNDQTN